MKQTDESIVQVPVSSLRSFPNHPFRIIDDESMKQLVDSIRLLGVLNPVIIRYMDGITWQLTQVFEWMAKSFPEVKTNERSKICFRQAKGMQVLLLLGRKKERLSTR